MRGTVLSASVLSVSLGIGLAAAGVVHVDPTHQSIVELIELALVLTLFSDGMFVERELLRRHWSPVARSLVIAMPITMGLLGLAAKALFPELSWPEAFLLGAVLAPTDPVVTSAVVASRLVPRAVRHTLNLESGLNDGLALPFVLFFLVFASPTGNAGTEAAKLAGEAVVGAGDRAGARLPRRAAAPASPRRRPHPALRGDLRGRLRPRRLRALRSDDRQRADRRLRLRDRDGGHRARRPPGLRRVRRERQRDPPGHHLLRLRRR